MLRAEGFGYDVQLHEARAEVCQRVETVNGIGPLQRLPRRNREAVNGQGYHVMPKIIPLVTIDGMSGNRCKKKWIIPKDGPVRSDKSH